MAQKAQEVQKVQKVQKARPPLTEAARDRIEAKMYLLETTIHRGMTDIHRGMTEGVELDIAMEYARECKIGRAQARDIQQRIARDFRRF